ncbi:hypothetical protein ACNI65_08370 [Roseateles sp. So40a]|uniref:hypothetical protein n=1 Tax=Roseateles sp. So40a TaxID=3400226 RepID=UPI003A84F9CD
MNAVFRPRRLAAAMAAMATTASPLVLIGLLALPAPGHTQSTPLRPEALRLRWTPDYHLDTPSVTPAVNDGPPPLLASMAHRRSTRPFLGLRLRFNQGMTHVSLSPRGQGVRLRLSHDF